MNFWQMWFQRGVFFRKIKKHPVSGTHGNKKWNDTYQEKIGKGQHQTKENGWDDDVTWLD
jgi:hypothetical protein